MRVDEPERPLRDWLRELSAARRAVRALTAKYGETRYYGTVAEVERRRARYEAWEIAQRIPKAERPAPELAPHVLSKIERLLIIQSNRCYLCEHEFTMGNRPTIEHVTPRVRGGRSNGNVLLAHAVCNGRKANRPPTPAELARLAEINIQLRAKIETQH